MDPIVLKQREFYKQHKTLDINFRINALKTLKKSILAYEDRINAVSYTHLTLPTKVKV